MPIANHVLRITRPPECVTAARQRSKKVGRGRAPCFLSLSNRNTPLGPDTRRLGVVGVALPTRTEPAYWYVDQRFHIFRT